MEQLVKTIKDFNLGPRKDTAKKDINILLLGETGVGKSTFINSLVNYLHFESFEKATREPLHVLIPSRFTAYDKHTVPHTVEVGGVIDKNEHIETGVSATQDVKTYLFNIRSGSTTIRLIDTPGMGDTRGIDQDNLNCENILNYIGKLHELHAICFLFRPQTTRRTSFFTYCLAQILSRLEKSAGNNLLFVFTNTRGTNYAPGETYSILREVVQDIKNNPPYVEIPLNVFCFDNESFKFLAALKEGIEFDNAVKNANRESWKKSTEECWRLISFIDGLKPHYVKSTSAVNEARRMIMQLAQPMAEIADLINDNISALERHQAHLSLDNQSLQELKSKLYMPVINLKVIKLSQPVTVCTSSKCAEVYQVGETNKWHYKQRCHDPCYLRNVPKEIIGSPELAHCAAINSATQMCDKCSCHFSVHMHVYYMTDTFEDKIIDESISKNIDSKEKVLENARIYIINMEKRKQEYEGELKIIVLSLAKFAHFLQNNAITPFSDSYKEYIQHLIIREQSLGQRANSETIKHLQTLLKQYTEMKKTFDEGLILQRRIGNAEGVLITPQRIQESIQELYNLKHNGDKIRELYHSQKTSRIKEHENTEYVHKTSFVRPENKKNINESKQQNPKEEKQQKDNKGKPQPNDKQKQQSSKNYQQNQRSRSRGRSSNQPAPQRRGNSPPPPYPVATNRNIPPLLTEPPRSLPYQSPLPLPPHVQPYAYPYSGYSNRDPGYGNRDTYEATGTSRNNEGKTIQLNVTLPHPERAPVPPPPPRDPYAFGDPYARDYYHPSGYDYYRQSVPVDSYRLPSPYDYRPGYYLPPHDNYLREPYRNPPNQHNPPNQNSYSGNRHSADHRNSNDSHRNTNRGGGRDRRGRGGVERYKKRKNTTKKNDGTDYDSDNSVSSTKR